MDSLSVNASPVVAAIPFLYLDRDTMRVLLHYHLTVQMVSQLILLHDARLSFSTPTQNKKRG